ncbi:MAG: hypothetical protein H6Q85_2800 [candidate division NC10 bacterium]|jgi:hypothetical protein|nr:hypothetical protein [candidate division NC10 bacterium]
MEYVLLASGIALAFGVRVICLIVELCGALPRPRHVEAKPIRPRELRPAGSQGRDTRSSRP